VWNVRTGLKFGLKIESEGVDDLIVLLLSDKLIRDEQPLLAAAPLLRKG
jgi:hypothetical protein